MEYFYGAFFGVLIGACGMYLFVAGRESTVRGDKDEKELEEILTEFRNFARSGRNDVELIREGIRRGERLLELKRKRSQSDG